MIRTILEECHFEYGDFISRKYGLIFAHVDTSEFKSLSGEIQSNTIFNKRNNRKYFISSTYEDSPISFDTEIVSDSPYPMTLQERKEVERQLFYRTDYQRLYIDLLDDCMGETTELVDGIQKRLYLNCRFTNPERIEDGGGRVIGYKCTVECDSLMCYQDEVEMTFDLENDSESSVSYVTVSLDTDMKEYTYPKVTFITGTTEEDSVGDVTIINQSDAADRLTTFVAMLPERTVTMKGELNYISGGYYSQFSDKNFIRLLDGDNTISILGNVSQITFTWQNRRYL